MLAWLLACQGADAPVVERTAAPPPAPSASNTTDVVPLPALDPIPAPVVVHTFIGGRVMLSAPDGTWQFSLFPDEQGLAIFDDVEPDSFVTVYLPVGGPLLRTVAGVYPGDELWIVDPPRPYQQEGTGVMDIEVSKPSDELSIGGFFTEGCGTMWAWTLPLARRWPVAEECIVNGTIDALATASTEDRVEGAVAFKLGVPVEGRAPDRYVSLVLDEWNLNPGIVEVTYPALEAEPAFVTAWLSGGRTGGPGNAVGIPSAQGQAVNGVLAVDDRFYDQASVDVRWTQYDADATRDILRTWVINDMPPDGTRTTVAVTPEDRPELLGSPGFDLAARTLTPDWSGDPCGEMAYDLLHVDLRVTSGNAALWWWEHRGPMAPSITFPRIDPDLEPMIGDGDVHLKLSALAYAEQDYDDLRQQLLDLRFPAQGGIRRSEAFCYTSMETRPE